MRLIPPVTITRALAFYLVALSLLAACSGTTAPPEHNDPSSYTLAEDVLWASPGGFDLTMDIYTPREGRAPYPVVVMFHGGGWLINDNAIMDQAAAYLATNGSYVVCNVNYRLLSDNDNTVAFNEVVEDAFGAVLWVKAHIGEYGGDGANIAVTGDSAGGHLAAMIVNSGDRLSSAGFAGAPLAFHPTYVPEGSTPETLAQEQALAVQAAALSYGAFDIYQLALDGFESNFNIFWLMSGSLARGLFGDGYNVQDNPERYRAVSPRFNIPQAGERSLPPQLLIVGSDDSLVTPASVQAYAAELEVAGHTVDYWEHAGRPHAFLDSGSNLLLGTSFAEDAPPALDVMLRFFDGVFYPQAEER